MTDHRDAPSLTAEQQAVVECPVDARLLVTAGPGAGKTHTLTHRLAVLIERDGLHAGEVLALTFSRSAVRELRARLRAHGDVTRTVPVLTFDSWALDLLTGVAGDVEWTDRSFDDRIRAATESIDAGAADELLEGRLRHVVVDELQDLVGARRELVEALIDRYGCGFTLVGDPAQAVYGFQVTDPAERRAETNRFLAWVRATYGDDLTELTLGRNLRVRTEEARIALPFAEEVRRATEARPSDTDAVALHRRLRDALTGTLLFGDLDDAFAFASLAERPGSTAILCRTNGQALLVSAALDRHGVPHALRRSAVDRVAPPWLAALFRTARASSVARADLDRAVATDEVVLGSTDPDLVWRSLLRVARAGRGSRAVDLRRLRTAIAEGRLPDELTAPAPASLTVSSFHRAKGLEFDTVLVVAPETPSADRPGDVVEEVRLLYVAMTRARDELMWLPDVDTRRIARDPAIDRWARYGWGGRRSPRRFGLELRGHDVDATAPAGTVGFRADPIAVQERLADEVRPGDAVVLERRFDGPVFEGQSPPYLLLHDGTPIGVTSERLHRDLYRHLRLGATHEVRRFPRRITGVRVDAVETVCGGTAAGSLAGLGDHGVWLAPRVTGLGVFEWDGKEETGV